METATCPVCGVVFPKKKPKQVFCERKCFAYDYRRKKREENAREVHPDWICQYCDSKHQLSFDPRREPNRLNGYVCPACGKKNKICMG